MNAYWATTAQVAATLAVALVLEARFAARRWRKLEKTTRRIEAGAFAASALALYFALAMSLRGLRNPAEVEWGEPFAGYILIFVTCVLTVTPIVNMSMASFIVAPYKSRLIRSTKRIEQEALGLREEVTRRLHRCAVLAQRYEIVLAQMAASRRNPAHRNAPALEWIHRLMGPVKTEPTDEDISSRLTALERAELAKLVVKYDAHRRTDDLRTILELTQLAVKRVYIEVRLERLRNTVTRDEIESLLARADPSKTAKRLEKIERKLMKRAHTISLLN